MKSKLIVGSSKKSLQKVGEKITSCGKRVSVKYMYVIRLALSVRVRVRVRGSVSASVDELGAMYICGKFHGLESVCGSGVTQHV